jgi:hypothetical protein
MSRRTFKSSDESQKSFQGNHRFEHWYRDNQVYFISARCREGFPAFRTEQAKAIFWDRFEHYTREYEFVPWVVSLLDNHYHVVGYCHVGLNLGTMMQRIHGSVAKLVNDTLETRWLPFWKESKRKNYFDGLLRNAKQGRLSCRYTLMQAVKAGIVSRWEDYPHTRVYIELEQAVRRAIEKGAFLEGVPYKRYQNPGPRSGDR